MNQATPLTRRRHPGGALLAILVVPAMALAGCAAAPTPNPVASAPTAPRAASPGAGSPSGTVPNGVSGGTKSLDLSGGSSGVPLTMTAAPATAIKHPDPSGGGMDVSADQVLMNVTTDSRTLAQARQSITSGNEGATFVRFLVDESDALLYEAKGGGGADTFLVYVAPAATPGYVCVSPTLAVSKNDNGKVYSEAAARQMLGACKSLVKQ
jgi:hypothetical protein